MNPGPLGKKHIKKKSMSPAVTEIGKYAYVPYYGTIYTYKYQYMWVIIKNKVGKITNGARTGTRYKITLYKTGQI